MKGPKQKLRVGTMVVVASLGITYCWFHLPLAAPMSEWLWSLYNKVFGGQHPGWATDLEFLTVLLGSVLMVSSVAWIIGRALEKRESTKP